MSTKQKKADQSASEDGVAAKAASLRNYFAEAKIELKKVTWPTKSEIKVTTIAVLIFVAIMSIFLGLLDLGLVKLVELILSIGAKG